MTPTHARAIIEKLLIKNTKWHLVYVDLGYFTIYLLFLKCIILLKAYICNVANCMESIIPIQTTTQHHPLISDRES